MTTAELVRVVVDTAQGSTWGERAAVSLLADHGKWIPALDEAGLVECGEDDVDGLWAEIDWDNARLLRALAGTGSELCVLLIACELARPDEGPSARRPFAGLTSLDDTNLALVLGAIRYAARGRKA